MTVHSIAKDIKHVGCLFLFIGGALGYGQVLQIPDSLLQQDYKTLNGKFYTLGDRNPKAELYAQAYLKKGKLESNTLEVLKGYHLLADMFEADYKRSTKYIDSALVASNGFVDDRYPEVLYGKKAYIERYHGHFKASLDNRLKQLELLKEGAPDISINYANYNIALLKRELGYYEDAKTLFKACLKYDVKYLNKYPKDSSGYLMTTSELVTTYRLNQQMDSALLLNTANIKTATNNGLGFLYELNAGIINYNLKRPQQSVAQIEHIIPELLNTKNAEVVDRSHLIDAYLFLGKAYNALSKNHQSLGYYKKLDSLMVATGYIVPEIKDVYLQLMAHYKSLGDKNKQLLYIDKLIYTDSILDANFRYLNHRLNKEYDLPKLMAEKEGVIASMTASSKNKTYNTLLISVLLGISMLGLGYLYYKQQTYKNSFKRLIESASEKRPIKPVSVSEVPEETVDKILQELNKFETRLAYLKPNVSSSKLAKSLGTNTKYLSIVLNKYQEKNLSQYINDLRIAHGIEKLKSDPIFRKYTIQAIANEIGFNTAEAFSKAFQKKTGILPSYFIKELIKTKE